jgi:hypothetical protein
MVMNLRISPVRVITWLPKKLLTSFSRRYLVDGVGLCRHRTGGGNLVYPLLNICRPDFLRIICWQKSSREWR